MNLCQIDKNDGFCAAYRRAGCYRGEAQRLGVGSAAAGTWERGAFKTFQKLMSLFQFGSEMDQKIAKSERFFRGGYLGAVLGGSDVSAQGNLPINAGEC